MSRTLTAYFNIYLSDDFEKAVREYYGKEDITVEDVKEFLERNIEPAQALDDNIEVEGGDTDGWFIQGLDYEFEV